MTTFAGGPEPSDDDNNQPEAGGPEPSAQDLPDSGFESDDVGRLDPHGLHLVLYKMIELASGVRLLRVAVLRVAGEDGGHDGSRIGRVTGGPAEVGEATKGDLREDTTPAGGLMSIDEIFGNA